MYDYSLLKTLYTIYKRNGQQKRFFRLIWEQSLYYSYHFYKENEAYLRIVFKFAQGELLFLQGNKENGLKQMKQAVHILQLLDCQTSAEYYQNGIEKLLKEN